MSWAAIRLACVIYSPAEGKCNGTDWLVAAGMGRDGMAFGNGVAGFNGFGYDTDWIAEVAR